MDGPPLLECSHYQRLLQGDPAPCSGTHGPTDKTTELLNAYLRVPVLEAQLRLAESREYAPEDDGIDWPVIVTVGSLSLLTGFIVGFVVAD